MDSIMQAAIAALLGLTSGLIGGHFAGRQQSKQEREKEARLAVAELTRYLEEPAAGLKLLSAHHQIAVAFGYDLNRKVAEVFQEQSSYPRAQAVTGPPNTGP